jgi:hypothetical protein
MSDSTADLKTVKKLCFIDMPFGKKTDPRTRVEIDCDQIYETAIRPAVEEAGLTCIRGDEERTGGIIHRAMFARLLLSDFVIVDMTTANPNVFYELGVRHASRPYTTIPIFATIGAPPFDVACVRAIPYALENGRIAEAAASELRESIIRRIHDALQGPVTKDSPLFQLFDGFPGIEISHELTDVFRDRVEYSARFRSSLAEARAIKPREDAIRRLQEIESDLGDLRAIEKGVLVDLFLSLRDVSGWNEMINLYERFPADVRSAVICRQQYALALNRRAEGNDREQAIAVLEQLIKEHGLSAETGGILGRIYKDKYQEAKREGRIDAEFFLDQAIDAYRKGFEAEPADYYPGVNAINLLLQKGDPESLEQVDYLTPLVSFAVARRGGLNSTDYWDLATVLELAVVGRDRRMTAAALPRVVGSATADWMVKTTADNLAMVRDLREGQEDTSVLKQVIDALRKKEAELRG